MTPAVYIGPTIFATFTWTETEGGASKSNSFPCALRHGTRGAYELRGFKLLENEGEVAYFYPTAQPRCSGGHPACVAMGVNFLMKTGAVQKIIKDFCCNRT